MSKVICTLVLLLKDNQVGLAKGKVGINTNKWNGYGGKVDAEDASIEEAAIRELAEESGVKAEVKDLQPKGMITLVIIP